MFTPGYVIIDVILIELSAVYLNPNIYVDKRSRYFDYLSIQLTLTMPLWTQTVLKSYLDIIIVHN